MLDRLFRIFNLHINCGVHIVHIFLIELFPQKLNGFAESLEMDNFPFPEELDGVIDIRIVAEPKDIVVGGSGFLLWYDHLKPTKIKLIYDGTSHFQQKGVTMTNIFDNLQNNTQFRFYKFPQSLISSTRYNRITNDAKLLYTLMLDRTSLSVKNSWYDRNGKLFIYFTIREIEESLQCSHNKAVRTLDELESVKLIQRVKQGQGRPTRIYVKKIL